MPESMLPSRRVPAAAAVLLMVFGISAIAKPPIQTRCTDLLLAPAVANQNIVTGPDSGTAGIVNRFDTPSLAISASFDGSPAFTGGVRVATGDVNGDGVADFVVAQGPGGGLVRVFDGVTLLQISSFSPYAGYTGGVFVAVADFNGDGKADIVTGTDNSGIPAEVRVFSSPAGAAPLTLLKDFFPFAAFTGGVRVAAGRVTFDGVPDIVAGTGPGSIGQVNLYDGSTPGPVPALLTSMLPYGVGFTGGVYVAAGDVNGDHQSDIITGPGAQPGQPPTINVFSGVNFGTLSSFLAYPATFNGGVRVAAGQVNGDQFADIVTVPGPTAAANVKAFDGNNNSVIANFFAYNVAFTGGAFVAAPPVLGPSAAGVSIGGRVLTSAGMGIRGAFLTLMDARGRSRTTKTNAFGYYTFENVDSGQSVVVSVELRRYAFAPNSRVITLTDAVSGLNFVADR